MTPWCHPPSSRSATAATTATQQARSSSDSGTCQRDGVGFFASYGQLFNGTHHFKWNCELVESKFIVESTCFMVISWLFHGYFMVKSPFLMVVWCLTPDVWGVLPSIAFASTIFQRCSAGPAGASRFWSWTPAAWQLYAWYLFRWSQFSQFTDGIVWYNLS